MKKWMYVISVGSMLAIFLAFYSSEHTKLIEKEKAKVAADEAKAAEEKKHRDDIEAKAQADAKKRADERAAEEAKKEADRVAKWNEDGRKIQEATDKYLTEADASSKKAAALEIQLSAVRANKEKLNREAFEMAKLVEQGKIDRRSHELEIQRMVEMVSRKAAESAMTRATPLPPPPPSS